jgi:GTP-binding protein
MRVKVRNAAFAGVFPHQGKGLPQVAFAGRSNVGKSSLINALAGRKSLVRTSKVPGKTRAVNLFRLDLVDLPPLFFVDLPGYGYARVSKSVSAGWSELISSYLTGNSDLRIVMLLVDIRRDLGEEERMIMDLLSATPARVVLVATKTDKLSYSRRLVNASRLARQAGSAPVITSAATGDGMDELWGKILEALKGRQG